MLQPFETCCFFNTKNTVENHHLAGKKLQVFSCKDPCLERDSRACMASRQNIRRTLPGTQLYRETQSELAWHRIPSLLAWHLTGSPYKRKMILEVPSHRCYVSGREGILGVCLCESRVCVSFLAWWLSHNWSTSSACLFGSL